MSEIVHALPREVVEFVAECRQKSYAIGAQPNLPTSNSFECGFRFEENGLVYQDVSLEQNRCFAGAEFVAGPDGVYYSVHYSGTKLPTWIEELAIDEAQHGFVMAYPTQVRFGALSFALERSIGSRRFTYVETSEATPFGTLNKEVLWCTLPNSRTRTEVVYRGLSVFSIFRNKS